MKKITSALCQASDNQFITFATAAGVLIATWVMYIQHGWITDDSVMYFEVARLFAAGEWRQGFALYSWPFYPVLIALIHQTSGLAIQHAAQILNAIFFGITTYSFTQLIRLAGGNKLTIACGALLLFSSPYIVGDILPMLLRDQGFWAFSLTSLIFFLKFHRDGKLKDAIYWQISIILAALFRIEAVTFLILLPLSIFSKPSIPLREKLLLIFKSHIITLSTIAIFLFTLMAMPSLKLADFGRIQELAMVFHKVYFQVTQGLAEKAELMGNMVLGRYLDGYGLLGISLTLIGIVLYKTASTAGWITIALLAVTKKEKPPLLHQDAIKVFCGAGILAWLNASIILLTAFVLSSRYLIPLGFILMILAAFGFASFAGYLTSKDKKDAAKKWLAILAILVLALSLLKNVLPYDGSHNYEQNAAQWLKTHNTRNGSVFISDPKVRYYADEAYIGRQDDWQFTLEAIQDKSIHHHYFLLISVNGKSPEQEVFLKEALPQHRLVNKFTNGSKKSVLIFARE